MCSPKTLLKIGGLIAVPLAIGFFAFPEMRTAIIGLAPFALFAICPLAMMFGMKGMMGNNHSGSCSECNHNNHKKEGSHENKQ